MPTDPNPQGGSLSDMAVEGTTVPSDAGNQRTIPSVARPDQISDTKDLGSATLAGAADNSAEEGGSSADVVTGTGDSLPAEVDSKRLQEFSNPDLSKGHGRYDKHVVAKDE